MIHYENIAALIFRVIAVLAMFSGLISWIMIAATVFRATRGQIVPAVFAAPVLYLIGGIIMFSLSRILAARICLDFNELKKG